MTDFLTEHLLWDARAEDDAKATAAVEQARRIRAILDACTPKQRAFVLDPAPYKSLRCPRRAGKSWGMTAQAAYIGESTPGSRILVISLTLKSTKENYWSGAPSGIFSLNDRCGLGLRFHHTDLVWWHQNGSRGRLAGAETRADIEYLRGAAAEADVVLLDECKSFAPALLHELIEDILEPGLMTRDGIIVMGGTPGLVPRGQFYEATCERARYDDGTPTCRLYETHTDTPAPERVGDNDDVRRVWSLHCWSIKDNTHELAARAKTDTERKKCFRAWMRALDTKDRRKWRDDHPSWRREYLGEWVEDESGLVYAFAGLRSTGAVNWYPEVTRDNPTGLPQEDGPWHLVMGVDFGYEDDFAVVLAGYSERLGELRVVAEHKENHVTVEQMATVLRAMGEKYGMPEAIVCDAGGLGKLVVESLNATYALPVVKAEKTEKYDHIELLNSDFHAGRVKIPLGSFLDHELCGLQWDLRKEEKATLVRLGRLRESPECPNHLCDALLYLWRYSYHQWAIREVAGPERGTLEYLLSKEKEAEARVARGGSRRTYTTDGYPSEGTGLSRELAVAHSLAWRN